MNNPFEFGKAVRGYQFYDWRKSCDELASYLRDGSTNVVLYAPRRYGKTSMVVRVLVGRLSDSNADLYAEIVHNLPPSQGAVVSAVAEEPVARLDEAYRQRHGLPGLSTVHSALRALVNRGLVEANANGYSIGDPIFARYLRETTASILP